ncbi:MAG TPA: tRNA (adenosine(37)-N6)-dimethylallyltransferase MiaA [Paracoccaceae bacterium]|nr:tRNA (adenosine(37)-N6)-dimethylallyltransferase MiaA [Paracoccaceae bacterium]HMO73589.1 tRNA (adenosine(37)-N6)-dimethylallyltransferase MiaA [Paracoccaceae bacterium]
MLSGMSREAPVLLAGPTASGKSALAMALAARDGRVVVNADALQAWSCWRVLTARPSAADEAAVPHALYGHLDPGADWSVGHWLRAVLPLLDRPVVVVGGTMLAFRALTRGLAEVPAVPAEVRARADALRAEGGVAALLAGLDPATAARIDAANPARVQRAWEVLAATGRGLAAWQAATPAPALATDRAEAIVLTPARDRLRDRIAARFGAMLAGGALDEVAAVLPIWDPRAPWAQAIGAAELVAHLRGETGLEEAAAAAVTATRHYAKRQDTAFRGLGPGWRRIDPG